MSQSTYLFSGSYDWLVLHPKWVGRIQGFLVSIGVVVVSALVLLMASGGDARSHSTTAQLQNPDVLMETENYIYQQFFEEKSRAVIAELPAQF